MTLNQLQYTTSSRIFHIYNQSIVKTQNRELCCFTCVITFNFYACTENLHEIRRFTISQMILRTVKLWRTLMMSTKFRLSSRLVFVSAKLKSNFDSLPFTNPLNIIKQVLLRIPLTMTGFRGQSFSFYLLTIDITFVIEKP